MRADIHPPQFRKRGPLRAGTTGQDGIVLIEALISMFLFSIGVLALVGMQALMSKNVTQAKLRGEASFLANQLIGQMWVDQANLNSYTMTGGACQSGSYARCTNWSGAVSQALPGGTADVAITGTTVDISVNWALPGESPSRFQIAAVITN